MAYVQNPGPRRASCVPAEERDTPGRAQRAWEGRSHLFPCMRLRTASVKTRGGLDGRGARWESGYVDMGG